MTRAKQKRATRRTLSREEREALAARARYVGSPEHKVRRWWGGLPEARQLPGGRVGRRGRQATTVCPLTTAADRTLATSWVQSAILASQYRFVDGDQDFPKRVWFEARGRIWYGVCVNRVAGEYKGWPINEDERRAILD